MERIQQKMPLQPSQLHDSDRQRRRPDDYTIREKNEIARLVVTPNARIACPRCAGSLEMVGMPAAGGGTIEVVWDFQCPGCRRRVLLTHLPEPPARAS